MSVTIRPRGVRRIFRLPRSRARMLRELDDEIQAHLAMRVEELRALGMGAADAEAEARRRFGDADAFHAYAVRRVARRALWLRLTPSQRRAIMTRVDAWEPRT